MAASPRQIARQEILARRDLVGTVISQRELREFNAASSPMWVCDVTIGEGRILSDVPVKGSPAAGSRFYAERGQTVLLKRNNQGRYDIVGPADTIIATTVKKTYNAGDPTPVTDENLGATFEAVPFEFYQGPTPPTPGTSRWNDGSTSFPFVRLVDANGNPI